MISNIANTFRMIEYRRFDIILSAYIAHTLGPRHVCIGTKVGKILIMEDAELKTSADIIGLVDSSHIPASSVSGNDVSETSEALGIRNAEHREIHALISYKGKKADFR